MFELNYNYASNIFFIFIILFTLFIYFISIIYSIDNIYFVTSHGTHRSQNDGNLTKFMLYFDQYDVKMILCDVSLGLLM